MDTITVRDYRCFKESQTVPLAPLTFLVGENSTGKTSFLAIIRTLWDVAFGESVPDFREEPYDLGTFREIAHNRGRNGGRDLFEAGFTYKEISFHSTFKERGAAPYPITRSFAEKETQFSIHIREDGQHLVRFITSRGKWEYSTPFSLSFQSDVRLLPFEFVIWQTISDIKGDKSKRSNALIRPVKNEPQINKEDIGRIEKLGDALMQMSLPRRPFAGAPVRSQPRRTYDPTRPSRDPQGEYIPTYLANLSQRDQQEWKNLKRELEMFGQNSGLFDEIAIKSLGETEGGPFHIQIRKFGRRLKGIPRNLIDVGYGVSQALPVLTELLRPDSPTMFLLQQPEVHLHPSAQAALGSLFCAIAEREQRQLVIETHSDYLLDRVRMDIRDRKTSLDPQDVSILYFESSGELDVHIHALRLDEDGNVLDAPPTYGQFFMDETRRSIGL